MAIPFRPLSYPLSPEQVEQLNIFLLELSRLEGTIRQPIQSRRSDASVARRSTVQVDVSRITPSISEVVSGVSTVVGTPAMTLSTVNTVGSTTTAVSVNSTIAAFGTQAPADLASSAAVGSSAYAARADHVHEFPPTIQSVANNSTLTLTDDATDQTLTSDLGTLNLRSAGDKLSLPLWTGGAENAPTTGVVLAFIANTADVGSSLRTGIDAAVSVADGSTYSSTTFRAIRSQLITSPTNAPTFTSITCIGYDQTTANSTLTSGTHTFTKRTGVLVHPTFVLQSGTGAITVTDYFGIEMATWPIIGNPGTVTNARAIHCTMPTLGSTIRRGVHLVTSTSNVGTEAPNVEGFYCEDITRGTTQRASFYAEGHASGTPIQVMSFYAAAHAVGSSRFSFYGVSDTLYQGGKAEIIGTLGVTGLATLGNSLTVAGNFKHSGTLFSLHAATGVTQSTGWSASGFTASKTLNGASFSLNEVMSVLNTLISHLVLRGDLAT